jgi:protein TonB
MPQDASVLPLPEVRHDSGHAEPLTRAMRRGVLALVIFFHVGIGWALTHIRPDPLTVGDESQIEVRMVTAEAPAAPPQEAPPPPPELESMIQPPPPDLPPPVFPVHAPPPPPPKPKAPPPRPQAAPAAEAPPQQASAAPAHSAAPKTVSVSEVAKLSGPIPVYPMRSRRAGETGVAMVRVFIDISGQPAQVLIQTSSGHPALDEAALSAVRAWRFRPYAEGGVPQAVRVVIPVKFELN